MVDTNTTVAGEGPVASRAVGEFDFGAATPAFRSMALSEPVRHRIDPRLAIALIASGVFQIVTTDFPEQVTESRWHYAWSEPVREKIGLKPYLQQTFALDTSPIPVSKGMGWYAPLTEPVREKIGLGAPLQQFATQDTVFVPVINIGYFSQYSEPVWPKKGIGAHLQQALAYHPRILPTPDVTVTWDSIETGVDVALIAVNVYESASSATLGIGAKVSITEVDPTGRTTPGGTPTSIRES